MLPFQTLILIDKESRIPAYKQLANKLIALIQEGKIIPGTILPGTRQLGTLLDLNRKTITRSYEELIAQDWIEVLPQKGFRVIPELPILKPRTFNPQDNFKSEKLKTDLKAKEPNEPVLKKSSIMVNDGFPDSTLLPYNEIMRNYKRQIGKSIFKHYNSLRDNGGTEALKKAACHFLNETRGLNINTDEILISRGAQMAIYIAASLLINPGDEVVVSDPNYHFADKIFETRNARIHKVPVDEDGLDVDALEKLLKSNPIKLLYIVPHHHHPTTVTLSASRRLKLLHLIKTHDFMVIEDDYDYDFHFKNSPILPLASSHHDGKIIYIGSFTKLLAPNFRIGYMIANPEFIRQAINRRLLMDLRGDTLMEQTLADMINNGDLGRHIKKSNKLYAERYQLLCQLFTEQLSDKISFTQPNGGLAVWVKFNRNVNLESFVRKAATFDLHFTGSTYINESSPHHNGIRFGFASLNEEEIKKTVSVMAGLLK